MFWLKLRQCKGSILPQVLTSFRQIGQSHNILPEDVNRPGEFEIPLQLFFYDPIKSVLYAANREFSSNACRKSIMRTIKNPQDGILVKIVLKVTNAALTSRSEMNSLNYDACI